MINTIRSIKLIAALTALAIAGCSSTETKPAASKPAATTPQAQATTKPTTPALAQKPASTTPAATAPATKTVSTTASKDQGTVVFFRESKFAGAAVSFKVRENDVVLGTLGSGNYFTVNLPKGPHKFVVHSEAKDEINMEVDPGQTYYFIGTLSMGFMAGHPHLQPSTAAVFESMKPKMKDSAAPKKK